MNYRILSLLVCAASTSATAAPLTSITSKKVTLELREAAAVEVIELMGGLAERKFVFDPCVRERKVTILMKNVPLAMVLDAIATRLGLVMVEQSPGGAIAVSCKSGPAPKLAPADPVIEREAWLDGVLDLTQIGPELRVSEWLDILAKHVGCTDVRLTGPDRMVRFQGKARARTLLEVMKDSAQLESISYEGRTMVVVSRPD